MLWRALSVGGGVYGEHELLVVLAVSFVICVIKTPWCYGVARRMRATGEDKFLMHLTKEDRK